MKNDWRVKMKDLSKKTDAFTESVIREMTRVSKFYGGYNLSQGFPDFGSPDILKEAAKRAIDEELNQYPITFGEKELREAIAIKEKEYNGIVCNPETEITVTCGASEAMISTMMALVNPGDEIIVFEPFYENYGPDGILSGATPHYVRLKPPTWSYDEEDLENAFNEKTKAIIINTPNNPTGKVFSKDELQKIADLCMKWDVYVITDEIYEHILFDGEKHISIASLPGMENRTVTINSISKTYSVTGWRVGWAIADERLTSRIRKVHDFFTVGAPTPFQHASVTALNLDKSYYRGLQEHYTQARNYVFETLENSKFKPYRPKGAYYIIADCEDLMKEYGTTDNYEFCIELIKRTGVAVVPGTSFYSKKEHGLHQVRFCFSKKWETLENVRKAFKDL
jgi:aminotransferase